jgi:hypothetical protein
MLRARVGERRDAAGPSWGGLGCCGPEWGSAGTLRARVGERRDADVARKLALTPGRLRSSADRCGLSLASGGAGRD